MAKERKKLIAGIILLIFFISGILAWNFFQKNPTANKNLKEDTQAVGYNPNLKKPENFDSKQVALPGFSKIVVKEGETSAKIALSNPSFNNVYFKYTVKFNKTGEKLLETDLIAPGKAIKNLPLPKDLKQGKYSLTISIKTFDKKSKSELNGGSNEVPLIVNK